MDGLFWTKFAVGAIAAAGTTVVVDAAYKSLEDHLPKKPIGKAFAIIGASTLVGIAAVAAVKYTDNSINTIIELKDIVKENRKKKK
jgi:NADPH:quinone reductase-like Zn-dependent oxidoreductase